MEITTTEKVKTLLESGKTKTEISRELNLRLSTVFYHIKKIENNISTSRKDIVDWIAVQQYYDEGYSIRQCAEKFCFATSSWNKAKKRGDIKSRPMGNKNPIEKILINPSYISSSSLKKRLLNENILKNICSECGQIPIWNNKPLTLELDHINGNPIDNSLENLRILCPHCHSQTPTYCKGFKEKRRKQKYCSECQNEIDFESKRCLSCSSKVLAKTAKIRGKFYISKEELKELIWSKPTTEVAKMFGVSDKAIEKRCRKFGIEKPPRGYWQKISH